MVAETYNTWNKKYRDITTPETSAAIDTKVRLLRSMGALTVIRSAKVVNPADYFVQLGNFTEEELASGLHAHIINPCLRTDDAGIEKLFLLKNAIRLPGDEGVVYHDDLSDLNAEDETMAI